jgi:GntR family transcriptional regulator
MEQIVARIIDQTYREGELLPSVRQIASDYLVNPLTAARAYRELGDLTETRRGIGLIVKEGVRDLLLRREQKRFLREEWVDSRAHQALARSQDLLVATRRLRR